MKILMYAFMTIISANATSLPCSGRIPSAYFPHAGEKTDVPMRFQVIQGFYADVRDYYDTKTQKERQFWMTTWTSGRMPDGSLIIWHNDDAANKRHNREVQMVQDLLAEMNQGRAGENQYSIENLFNMAITFNNEELLCPHQETLTEGVFRREFMNQFRKLTASEPKWDGL